ncbi:DNA polymerase III subunit beta [Candidatus Peregrinibacteria bacterium]|jgi:DNA polymerase III subunit beta|nr:DNA polymerase III subunit beta [Candidatus Peregrinibacteria bacterium]MBT7483694.1 DNA polymerase III subunit beta [Candidatus Peregrinibacteria bacterium]MBT7702903.1 DNA polymerase III subunit beta [Candidatus Peregrinibacteria bacterium]
MKVKCRQKDLAFALNLVNRAVSPNTTLPVLNNILMKAEGKRLYFSATNLEVAMTYFIDVEVFNEGAITIPAKLITSYVSLLKDEEVELKLEDRLSLSIKTPLAHTKIKGIDPTEFPIIPTVEKGDEFTLTSEGLERAITQTVFAASSNVSRPVLTGVLFRIEKEDLSMVATDSYRLSERKVGLKKGVSESHDCIIPSHTIAELGKILSYFGEAIVECHVTKNQILFSVQNLKIISRLIDGSFPDYKRIIPSSSKTKLKVNVQDFILAVKKVSLFVQETNNNVKISVTNNGKLIISTDETQIGEGTAEVDVKIEGNNNKVALNAQYILDCLSHINDETIDLAIDNKLSPVTIKPEKKEARYTHIIMPLKL